MTLAMRIVDINEIKVVVYTRPMFRLIYTSDIVFVTLLQCTCILIINYIHVYYNY